jgi:CheY-like chemotaxis protein
VELLRREGHHVEVVSNGQLALEAWRQRLFDLILMDVQMPELDGLSATRAIREFERALGAHTPIIAMTAYAMAGDRERCLAAGMDGYIAKPLNPAELEAAVAWAASGRSGVLAADAAEEARGRPVAEPLK